MAFLIALGWALVAFGDAVSRTPQFAHNAGPSWLIGVDLATGLTYCVALWVRRRWPVGLAVASLPLALFSVTAGLAMLIVVFTVLVHRPLPIGAALVGFHLAVIPLYTVVRPTRRCPTGRRWPGR